MVQVIFTLDYEIYGNGCGSIRELVLEPTERLAEIFRRYNAPFVVFAEALEFAKIEEARSDPDIGEVRRQLRELREAGHEIALHLHPWWANARLTNGAWQLDWTERNICALPPARIEAIVGAAIAYLRDALEDPAYTPQSFRSGLWLMQPTANMARTLARHGVRVDSSVFKGGRTRALGLDYRPALRNGSVWRFSHDVNVPETDGLLLEVPIHTKMVPFWEMLGKKRLRIQKRVPRAAHGAPLPNRWTDFLRFRYPRKFDFCRMTLKELTGNVEAVLRQDGPLVDNTRPLVAIGHSKDLVELEPIQQFLGFLRENQIAVKTLSQLLTDFQCKHRPLDLARELK